jgi:glycosyltransferase involved in cell wall biosynthesis
MTYSLSIIIPLFNRKELIKETLDSIKQQSEKTFECIIVDDHSTDGSFETCSSYVKDDTRFLVKRRKSPLKGASVCRNEGIDLASGTHIMFLDSDDLLDPECVSGRLLAIKPYPKNDFYVFQVGLFDHDTYKVSYLWSSIEFKDDLLAFINSKGWSVSNTVFKREFLKNNHYFDEMAESWQDVEFHIRALLKTSNYKKFLTKDPDVYIRISGLTRVSNTNLSYGRISSRIRGYQKIDYILVKNNISFHHQAFSIYYLKYLEIAARTLKTEEYISVRNFWIATNQKKNINFYFFKAYLDLQCFLTRYNMYYIGSVFYKLLRLVIPGEILYSKNKKIKLNRTIDLNNRLNRSYLSS